jgi:serine/threonine protein kinase
VELNPSSPNERLQLGKYEVIKYLAAGGMAEVFLAKVTGLLGFDKPVVIKRILPHLANRQDFIGMFLDEARIGMLLQHPNIVQTYDVGVANRNYFIAMEYLHGETVRSIMRTFQQGDRKMPVEHAVHIGSAVANALHYAHERAENGQLLGIVHRDVTPQNIMVTFDGTVKLLDFGIAKAQNRFGETRSGTLKGKLPYMSPEQCRGEELDRRSDVFSLGIMLYELTLGRRLFSGVSDFQILKQIAEGEITPPTQFDPEYPPALEAIVLHALQKSRADRYQTAREMLIDLDAFSRQERLHTSNLALSDFVGSVFKEKVDAWKHAAEVGHSLEDLIKALPDQSPHDDSGVEHAIAQTQGALPSMTPSGRDEALPGPDIPVTPPFSSLEFTQAGAEESAPPVTNRSGVTVVLGGSAANESVSDSTASLAVSNRRTSLAMTLLGALGLVAIGGGATFWLLKRNTPVPAVVNAPAPAPAATSPPLPPVILPQPVMIPTPAPPVEAAPPPASDGKSASSKHGKSHPHGKETPVVAHTKEPAPAPKVSGEGTLVLATTPWCNVTIDSASRGTTPLTVTLPAGPHTVVLTNAEFKVKRSLSISIAPNATLRKRLDFDTP